MSRLVTDLPADEPPAAVWQGIRAAFDRDDVCRPQLWRHRPRFSWVVAVAAAAMLTVVGLVVQFGTRPAHEQHDHEVHLAATFGRFLEDFAERPQVAQQCLCGQCAGRRVDAVTAQHAVGYCPAALRKVPAGYRVDDIYVLDMPCCRCSETIYRRDTGGVLAIFEHDSEHDSESENWFGDRSVTMVRCHDTSVSVYHVKGQMAATWDAGMRQVTAVGFESMDEVHRIVGHFRSTG